MVYRFMCTEVLAVVAPLKPVDLGIELARDLLVEDLGGEVWEPVIEADARAVAFADLDDDARGVEIKTLEKAPLPIWRYP
ncbi:hypothetical protein [Mesorhizobium sp.]|uniref:hypothetical protein n=1 Tax=Mesorhizobium sp. TaxID=1871066 RepID=UPI0012043979|nr:hypothetical protein [Mesorhizobium sp.]TIM06732.1 MAG: hypothetical protein E5Y62_22040 [Mesorhizobium sp.]